MGLAPPPKDGREHGGRLGGVRSFGRQDPVRVDLDAEPGPEPPPVEASPGPVGPVPQIVIPAAVAVDESSLAALCARVREELAAAVYAGFVAGMNQAASAASVLQPEDPASS